jgi:hypothetical protein
MMHVTIHQTFRLHIRSGAVRGRSKNNLTVRAFVSATIMIHRFLLVVDGVGGGGGGVCGVIVVIWVRRGRGCKLQRLCYNQVHFERGGKRWLLIAAQCALVKHEQA